MSSSVMGVASVPDASGAKNETMTQKVEALRCSNASHFLELTIACLESLQIHEFLRESDVSVDMGVPARSLRLSVLRVATEIAKSHCDRVAVNQQCSD